MYGLDRKTVDAFALESQIRWGKANSQGLFDSEIAPVILQSRKGEEIFKVDEHARPTSTAESLAKLKPVFIKDTGLVTAGNASGKLSGCHKILTRERNL